MRFFKSLDEHIFRFVSIIVREYLLDYMRTIKNKIDLKN